jgi:hypothetical protein
MYLLCHGWESRWDSVGWRKLISWMPVALVLTGITGCGFGQAGTANTSAIMQSPIPPIVLNVLKNGLVIVAEYSGDPVLSGVALLGEYGIDAVQGQVNKARAEDPAATLLVIRHTVHGKQEVSIYKINDSRDIQVAMNGKFLEEVTPNEITITAQRGTRSTIVISNANGDERDYRKGTMTLDATISKYSRANLDTGATVDVPPSQAEIAYDFISGRLNSVNGSTVALWKGTGEPSLSACASLPVQQWSTGLIGVLWFTVSPGTTWCVHTAAGRYGAIVLDSREFGAKLSYVLWEKP